MEKYESFCISSVTVCVTLSVIVLVAMITFSCADDRRQIVAAIKSGANPVLARCAVKGTASYDGPALLCDRALEQ